MAHDPIFDSAENQALLVVCARKTIRTAAIAGIVWGSINLLIGYFAVQANPLNAGILARYRPEMTKYYYDPAKFKTYLDQLGIKYPTVHACPTTG